LHREFADMSVTFAGVNRGRGISRQRWLAGLLAISVAVNLCVVAGALWTRQSAREAVTAAERFEHLAASLHRTDPQREAFAAYVVATRARTAQLPRDVEPLLETAWTEIAKPQADETTILHALNDASTRWRTSQRETIEATMALLATFSPEQRAQFI